MASQLDKSNYLLSNAAEVFWNDNEVVADMLKQILSDPERLENWQSILKEELSLVIEDNAARWQNFYSMWEPLNPYKDPHKRVVDCATRVWQELNKGK